MRLKTTLAAAALLAAGTAGGAAAQQVNETRATGATGSVEVQTVAGRVRVVGWARNQVQVTGTLGSSAERVEIENDAGSLVVRVVTPGAQVHVRARDGKVRGEGRAYASSGRGADIEVRVPARKDVEINAVSADAEVQGIDGTTEVHTQSGSIRVSGGHAREITVNSRSGEVDVTADADRVEAVSLSGGVRVAGSVRDRVEANSVSGTVNVTAAAGEVGAAAGSSGTRVFSHWLAKIRSPVGVIDVIFSSGNGRAGGEGAGLAHATEQRVLGRSGRVAPAEESLRGLAVGREGGHLL